MATVQEAQEAILDAIVAHATYAIKNVGNHGRGQPVKDLAEAWAWLERPAQPHGGGAAVSP